MLFYAISNEIEGIHFSPVPVVDKLLKAGSRYLRPGLPLWILQHCLRDVPVSLPQNSLEVPNGLAVWEKTTCQKLIRGLKDNQSLLAEQVKWDDIDLASCCRDYRSITGNELLFQSFLAAIKGREIYEADFISLARYFQLKENEVIILLHKAVLRQKGLWVACLEESGNNWRGNNWRCARCGQRDCREWPSLYGKSATCLSCKSMGALTSLQALFRSHDRTEEYAGGEAAACRTEAAHELKGLGQAVGEENLGWQFTPSQKLVAGWLQKNVWQSEFREFLVWAACGAGKTEITFPLIEQSLLNGRRILFAAPRLDVVQDLQPRLERYFKQCSVKVFSANARPDWEYSLLNVATTHQVLKFYQSFDLIILDEMDAYPYADSSMLKYGIRKALKRDGRMVYLSATPSADVIERARQTGMFIRLPVRFHGMLAPVPEIVVLKLPSLSELVKLSELPGSLSFSGIPRTKLFSPFFRIKPFFVLLQRLSELAAEGPLLLFVPVVELVAAWVKTLRAYYPGKRIEGSWSSDPDRKKRTSSFLEGDCDIFVSTSILERGITVPGVQVAVLYADHVLFEVRVLVQMAGRVGRTEMFPRGRVIFIGAQKTRAMIEAISWINEQNNLAQSGGFIH